MKTIWNAIVWLGHPFCGALTFALGEIHWVYALIWAVFYICYQMHEYAEKPDTCAVDLRDYMIGFGVWGGGIYVWRIIL